MRPNTLAYSHAQHHDYWPRLELHVIDEAGERLTVVMTVDDVDERRPLADVVDQIATEFYRGVLGYGGVPPQALRFIERRCRVDDEIWFEINMRWITNEQRFGFPRYLPLSETSQMLLQQRLLSSNSAVVSA